MLKHLHTFFTKHSGKIGQTVWAVLGTAVVQGWISKPIAEILCSVMTIWTGAYLTDKALKAKT